MNKKLLQEILSKANIITDGGDLFDKLLAKRIELSLKKAPIEEVMDATAEIAKFELEEFSGKPINYNLESLPIIDQFIDYRREFLQKTADNSYLASIWFGAFLGQVVINELNGEWQNIPDEEWETNKVGKVKIDNKILVSPSVTILRSIDDPEYKIEGVTYSLMAMAKDKNLPKFMNSNDN